MIEKAKFQPTFKEEKKSTLVIVCGLQGSGKTIVAREIAKKINAILLRSDIIRKEMYEEPQYSQEEMHKVIDELLLRGKKILKKNRNVILDATFLKEERRLQAKEIADKLKASFKIVEVVALENIVKERIKGRNHDESDATFETYLQYKKNLEPISEKHITIDNSGTVENTYKKINKYFSNVQ